jgi:hypothetical protein
MPSARPVSLTARLYEQECRGLEAYVDNALSVYEATPSYRLIKRHNVAMRLARDLLELRQTESALEAMRISPFSECSPVSNGPFGI